MNKQYIMTCSTCKKKYDLVKVADTSRTDELYCPHCKCRIGKRQN